MNTYHVQAQKACFVTPISTLTWKRNNSLLPHPWQSSTTALPRRRSSFRASLFEDRSPHQTHPTSNNNNNNNTNSSNNQVWNGVRKVIRISAISATLILSPVFQQQLQSQQHSPRKQLNFNTLVTSTIFKSSTLASPTATAHSSSTDSQTSDVEAAAMTLGAVTLGGLFMRLIINRGRNSEAEKQRLADQCDRLQKEEHIRSLRIQRTQLESLDDDPGTTTDTPTHNDIQLGNDKDQTDSHSHSSPHSEKQMSQFDSLQQVTLPTNDNDLMSDLRKRMDSITNNDDTTDSEEDNDNNSNNKHNNNNDNNNDMRHNPIPDRGTGSALLERPSASSSGDNSSNGESENGNEDNLGKPDELEMLKRMWNLSPPDKKE